MNGRWTTAHALARCGFGEGHSVPVHEPVYELASGHIRCLVHAPAHALEDLDAIERACVASEARRTAAAPVPAEPTPTLERVGAIGNRISTVVAELASAGDRRLSRVPAPRAPQPFATVADVPDPKADAFND